MMNSAASLEFLLWLVATTGLYWLLPSRMRRYLLMLSTATVLAAVDLTSLFALSAMTAVVLVATQVKDARQPAALLAGCFAIVAALLTFKLLDANYDSVSIMDRLVPLGLSYYSLRCVHVLVEQYLERIEQPSAATLIEYLFFPATIVAGPIHRYPEFVAQRSPKLQFKRVSEGLERILYGYVKIVVLSNYLLSTKFFPWALSLVEPSTSQYQYLDALDYGLTLYLQFSGYSDIAIGFALLLGHRIIENFSWPFLKANIAEFWRSWHISLTRLCREYVFTSVHATTRRAWMAVLATMLAISLWHGLTLNYLAWGLYHAMGLVIFRAWSGSSAAAFTRKSLPMPVRYLLGWFVTFQFVIIGFVFTKESSLTDSIDALVILLGGASSGV